jgi:HSP20 family protein
MCGISSGQFKIIQQGEKIMSLYIQSYPYRRTARRLAAESQIRPLGVNVREEENAYVLSARVPGLKAEDLNIQVLENVVSIEGEYKTEEAEYLLSELPSGSFRRSLRMPVAIEAENVEARIEDGILTLNLPKAESARPRKIQVSVN